VATESVNAGLLRSTGIKVLLEARSFFYWRTSATVHDVCCKTL